MPKAEGKSEPRDVGEAAAQPFCSRTFAATITGILGLGHQPPEREGEVSAQAGAYCSPFWRLILQRVPLPRQG